MENGKDIAPDVKKAIAVKGDGDDQGMPPKIIAKGEGVLAERLLDIAFAEGVKVRKDKDLTELLDAFDVESPIPLEALHAVSLILERVYKENQTMAGEQGDSVAATATQAKGETVIEGQSFQPKTDRANR